MKSLVKVILMSMYRKKGRSIMLVLSIVFSVGLSYTVLSLSDLTEDIIMSQYKKEYGETDILISKLDYSEIDEEIQVDSNQYDYLIEGYNIFGYTYLEENLAVNMFGYTENEIDQVFDIEYVNQSSNDFTGNKVIIGKKNSDLYDLNVGDTVTITISNVEFDVIVHAVATKGTSFLDYSPNTLDVIIAKDFVIDTIGFEHPNVMMISSNNLLEVDTLTSANEGYIVTDLFGSDNVDTEIQKMVIPMGIMAMAVVLIGSFIIASTFKVIVIDRMYFLGTLRSIGATKSMTTKVLLIESAIYGLIGSIIGIFSGIGILHFMAKEFFGSAFIASIDVNYIHIPYVILTILFGVIVSVFSALLPIIKTNKYSIKDILFQKIKNTTKFSWIGSLTGLGLISIAFVMMNNVGSNDYMIFSLITIILTLLGGVLVIPLLIKAITPILNIVLYPLFKENTKVVMLNIKNDKTLINNIILLSIGLGTIFMINSFSSDVGRAVNEIYDLAAYDILIINETVTDDFIEDIKDVPGVSNVYETSVINNIETSNGFVLPYIDGINPADYEQYGWDVFKNYISPSVRERFNREDTIIITSFLAKKYELDVGDTIGIMHEGAVHNIEIIAIFPTILQNGTQSYINESLFEEVFGTNTLKTIYISADDTVSNEALNVVKRDIKESYSLGILPIVTLKEMKEINEGNNSSLFMLMRGISVLAMVIGAVGIINNFFVSFISRRKLIATLRSIGLSKAETVKLFLIESSIVGLIGSLIGVLFGIVLYYFMGFVVEGMNISSEVQTMNINEMIFVFVSGMVICLTTSLIPSLSMANKNIVSEIKYE